MSNDSEGKSEILTYFTKWAIYLGEQHSIAKHIQILNLIGWRAPLEFADEKRMSLLGIRSATMRSANEPKAKNPYYSRVWLHSLDVAEEVIDVLLKGRPSR